MKVEVVWGPYGVQILSDNDEICEQIFCMHEYFEWCDIS